jgi:hypothetical protein
MDVSDGVGGVAVKVVSPIAGGVLGSATGGVDSLMEITLLASSLSTWKLNNPKAMSKPPVLVEAVPITLEMGSMVVVAGEWMANTGVDSTMLGDAVSMVGAAMPMMVDDEVVSTMVGAAMPTMAGGVVSMLMSMSMADKATSMLMADEVMSMSMVVGDAELTAVADDEPSTLVDVDRSAMVGEGAGESVDLDPIVPTVGTD